MTSTDVAASKQEELAMLVRKVHRSYPSGLTIVAALEEDAPHGLVLSAFSSISLDPPTIMVSVAFTSSNHARFYSADVLGVNIVSAEQASVARKFAQSGTDKFSDVAWHKGKFGAPILDGSSGYFEIEVQERILAHTHTIFIGRVLDAGVRDGAAPLIYANGGFYEGSKLVNLEGEVPSELEQNRCVIETMWKELEANHDWALLDKVYAEDYVRVGRKTINRAQWVQQLRELYAAFPDHSMEVLSTIAEGNCVVYKWSAVATHKGVYCGAPPTGKTARASGITISRFRDGRIVEEQASWNKLAFLEDLGISTLGR